MVKDIFIAFTGPKMDQFAERYEISPGYECWNLAKFRLEEFLQAAQQRIPPMNDNVLRNYRRNPGENTPFGIGFEDYAKCSWGLLLPDLVPDTLGYGCSEILFLLNLYSPRFLRPVFYLSDFGVDRPDDREHHFVYYGDQAQSHRFMRKEFVEFYKTLASESGYGSWQADRMGRWGAEDMRVFVASLLFRGLRTSEYKKDAFTWQRESADMATILEALFTAGTGDNSEVGYKLRKRVGAMMAYHFPSIEEDIKDLYKQRSTFVHGEFFLQIRKKIEVKNGHARLPSPPFGFLYREKELIRFALTAYIYLNKLRKEGIPEFSAYHSVLELLEAAILDLKVRAAVNSQVERLFKLFQ
jgi:hypothetical protein